MNDRLPIFGELSELSGIAEGTIALVQYALCLGDGSLSREGGRWVMRPDNYVTFEVHSMRVRNLTVTIRGNPDEFLQKVELPLTKSMNGYSAFRVEGICQFEAAFSYIRHARELFERGRSRTQKQPIIIEK